MNLLISILSLAVLMVLWPKLAPFFEANGLPVTAMLHDVLSFLRGLWAELFAVLPRG